MTESFEQGIYMPEYLGGEFLEIHGYYTAYQLGVMSVLVRNNGALGESGLQKIAPQNETEAKQVQTVATAVLDTILQSSISSQVKAIATSSLSGHSGESRKVLFAGSYHKTNPFSSYTFSSSGEEKVVDTPVELRQFAWRSTIVAGRAKDEPPGQLPNGYETIRFSSIEELHAIFPGLSVGRATESQAKILQMIHGEADMPYALNARQADEIINTIGAGTLARALEKIERGLEYTEKDQRIAQLAKKASSTFGGELLSKIIEGRMLWGIHNARLRTGDQLPKVTLPKPGV